MNAFMNVHLNTIRSILLKDIYDLLYPVLQDKPISRNENILYGMLSKLSEFISAFKEDAYQAGPHGMMNLSVSVTCAIYSCTDGSVR